MSRLSPTTIYYLLRAVGSFAFSMIIAYEFVMHTITVGLDPVQLVTVGVVLELMTIFGEVPTGVVADAYSRRLSIIIGVTLMGLGFLIEGVWPTYAMVLLAQVGWGLGFTFISGASIAWITDEIGEENARPVLLHTMQIGQVASLTGIIVATVLANVSVRLPIIIGAVLYLLLAVMMTLLMEEHRFKPIAHSGNLLAKTVAPFREGVALVRVRPILRIILILGIVIGIYAGSFDRLHTLHLDSNFVLPQIGFLTGVSWFGILRGIVAIGSLALTELVRRRNLDSNQAITQVMSALYTGMIVMTLLFVLSSQFWLAAIGYCASQMLRNTSRPLLGIWINQNTTSAVRATVHSFYWQSNALGQVVGTPPIGWLATRLTVRAALTVSTVVYGLVLPLLWMGRGEEEQSQIEI